MIWGNPPKFVPAAPKLGAKVTPEALAKSGSEDGHQMALFAWAADNVATYSQLAWLFAVPNGGQRHIAEATKFVATGLRKGVPDVCLPAPIPKASAAGWVESWHGCWIEMKIEKHRKTNNGGVKQEQLEWHAYLRRAGYYVAVCYNWKEARDVLINYLEGRL